MTIKINCTKGKLLNDLRKIKKLIGKSRYSDIITCRMVRITGKKDNDYIIFSGTDGCTLSEIYLNIEGKLANDLLGYVYKNDLNELIKLIQANKAGGDSSLQITDFNKDNISFCGNGWNLDVKNYSDTDYFDIDKLFNQYENCNDYITVNTSEFKKVLKELADNHSSKKDYAVVIKNDPLTKSFIVESTCDKEQEFIFVEGQTKENDFKMRAFNPRFLFNAINDSGKKTECKLCFCDPSKSYDPVKILENGNRHLVLPVRLNN